MKKLFVIIMVIVVLTTSATNIQAFADTEVSNSQNIVLTTEEFYSIIANGNSYNSEERASGLIYSGGIGIDNDFKMLRLSAILNCSSEVVKCGFEDIIVQQRSSASSSWTTYHTFDDSYVDSCTHSIIRAVTTVTGYEYRVICTFYAKKNIFSVQRIDIESNILAF